MSKISYPSPILISLFWFLLSIVISSINDNLTKLMAQSLSSFQVIFFRFFISTITLLPFIFQSKYIRPNTRIIKTHFIRGAFIYTAMLCWCISFNYLPMATMTTISFTIPLFVLSIAKFILKEEVKWPRILAALIGFLGVVIICEPYNTTKNYVALIPLIVSVILFSVSDIINKNMLKYENSFNMIFYCALFATILSAPLAILFWQPLTLQSFIILCFLGCGSNLIIFCILKAFSLGEISLLSSIRYTEIFFSSVLAYCIFGEVINFNTGVGIATILLATFSLTMYELYQARSQPAKDLAKISC